MARKRTGTLEHRPNGWHARITVDVDGKAQRRWINLETSDKIAALDALQRLVAEATERSVRDARAMREKAESQPSALDTVRRASVGAPRLNSGGYVLVRIGRRDVREHRAVVERLLGRPLAPHENVHHKNGDRTDNRPENLELWSRSQPPGQRVADKVAWAIEMLRLWSPQSLAQHLRSEPANDTSERAA